ncbi:cysteine peptidase family C39 domain-containing protein [Candidatus Deferrimicrobium sp.]|uniref:cysteine peptidase family C39 domain-containing protein n=1 Tax=Candidatus Deferrimicrobium sp. TaxID=3060586 RepID=UPI003C4D13F5
MARRAVHLHGCALPHCAPLLRRLRRTLPLRALSVRFTAVKKCWSLFTAALLTGGILFTQGGCAVGAGAGKGAGVVQSSEAPAPLSSVIAGVPFLPQEDDTCGPSSLAMVLRFLGRNVDTAEIVRETRTEGLKGTLITDLAAAARRRGFAAEVVDLDLPRLRERISAGVPVILLVDLGVWSWSRPHYLVAYGWTPEGVVAHSGREQGKVIPFSTLDAQWAKMGRLAILVRRQGAL